jgi:L-histidine Nalpha-methyltransferase / hercynylcysteine S-oxide synthase
LRKIRILLEALDRAEKNVEYYALDLSLTELERTLSAIPKGLFRHVKCLGLHGTYDDGLAWLKSKNIAPRQKTILSMGSSIGNFKRADGANFLKNFSTVLRPGDTIILGMDGCKDPEKVYHAYNDKNGITHEFIRNGLRHANRIFGHEAFDISKWNVVGEYDKAAGRHHAFVFPTQDTQIDGVAVLKDERIRIEESYKFSALDVARLWKDSGLTEGARWAHTKSGDYGEYS